MIRNCGDVDGGGMRSGERERSEGEEWRKGWISAIGRRRSMEDAVAVEEMGQYKFFGVYEGGGVANACRQRLHRLLDEVVDGRCCGVVQWDKAMSECFRRMDSELSHSLSTALVVLVANSLVVVANCGRSRAILCRDGHSLQLSRHHTTTDRPDDNWNRCRVLTTSTRTRSIGDDYLKPDVISELEVTVWERAELDGFLVIASDGLWDVMPNEFVCEVVRWYFEGKVGRKGTASEASALLAELAIARGSKDNISVVVVDLKN